MRKVNRFTTKDEEKELLRIFETGKKNGLKNLKILNSDQIKKYEPFVNGYKQFMFLNLVLLIIS